MMAADLTFRLARPDEAKLVSDISARAYVPAYMSVLGTAPKPAFEDYAPRIMQGCVWIAELAGKPAGVLVTEDAPNHLAIYSVAVEPAYQGKGVAGAMIGHAESLARARNKAELRLFTNQKMLRNVRLYQRCGFVEVCTRPHPSRPGDVLVDMSKKTDDAI